MKAITPVISATLHSEYRCEFPRSHLDTMPSSLRQTIEDFFLYWQGILGGSVYGKLDSFLERIFKQ
jgi:hypothetical protein